MKPEIRKMLRRSSQINPHAIGETVTYICCDCGLAHDVVPKVDVQNKGVLMMRWIRNNHSTGQFRRYREFRCKDQGAR